MFKSKKARQVQRRKFSSIESLQRCTKAGRKRVQGPRYESTKLGAASKWPVVFVLRMLAKDWKHLRLLNMGAGLLFRSTEKEQVVKQKQAIVKAARGS